MGGSQPEESAAQAALGNHTKANEDPKKPKYHHVRDQNVPETQLAAEAEAENLRDAQEEAKKKADAKAERELDVQNQRPPETFITSE